MDGWCKPKDAAKYSGVTTKTFRSWLRDGLKHSRLKSGHILVKVSAIDEYLSKFEISESKLDKEVTQLLEGF